MGLSNDASRIELFQTGYCIVKTAADKDEAVIEASSACLQGVRHVSQVTIWIRLQVFDEIGGRRLQGRASFGREL
jgi:hypothetical protein